MFCHHCGSAMFPENRQGSEWKCDFCGNKATVSTQRVSFTTNGKTTTAIVSTKPFIAEGVQSDEPA